MSGLSYARMRSAVRRDSFSDYLPLVAWDEDTEAFLCIDDTWGHAWELVPTAYMFAMFRVRCRGCSTSISRTGRCCSSTPSRIR